MARGSERNQQLRLVPSGLRRSRHEAPASFNPGGSYDARLLNRFGDPRAQRSAKATLGTISVTEAFPVHGTSPLTTISCMNGPAESARQAGDTGTDAVTSGSLEEAVRSVRERERLVEEANNLPGVAEAMEVYRQVAPLVPQLDESAEVGTTYATGGNAGV